MNHSEKCGSCKHEIYQCAAGKFLFSGRFIVNKQRKPGCLNTIYNKQTIEALVHAEFPFLHARFFLSEYHSFESGVSVVSKLNLQGTQYRFQLLSLQYMQCCQLVLIVSLSGLQVFLGSVYFTGSRFC